MGLISRVSSRTYRYLFLPNIMTLIDEVLQSTSRAVSPDSYAIDNDYVKLPKFRDLEDFLFQIERYSLPTHGNTDRLNNRMINNILYYQSNYSLNNKIHILKVLIQEKTFSQTVFIS